MGTLKKYLLTEGVYDPAIFKAIFFVGGSGSGKTYVASKTADVDKRTIGDEEIFSDFDVMITGGSGLKFMNSDELFEFLLSKKKMTKDLTDLSPAEATKTAKVRGVAKKIADAKKKLLLNGRLGLIVDGTGKDLNKIKKQKEELEALGYDTKMVFVNVPLNVAIERNMARKRKVMPDIVTKAWADVQHNLGGFQTLFGKKGFIIVDNHGDNKKALDRTWKILRKFVKAPITNPIAKAWIETELEKKKR